MNININNEHQIIFPGKVISRHDPKMLGRVRAKPVYSEFVAEMIKSVDKTLLDGDKDLKQEYWWSKDDIFVFLPLLPFYISQVPDKDEYIHIIYQNKKFLFGNQFYIQGPFTSPMKLPGETQESSEAILSAGDRYKLGINLKNNDGTPMEGSTKGIFPEPGDNALLGRGSADVIVKPEEILIRAGKFVTSDLNRQTPPSSKNDRAFLQLSNFISSSSKGETEESLINKKIVNRLKKLIIWNIQSGSLNNTVDSFSGNISLHRVLESSTITSDNFTLGSIFNISLGTDYTNEIDIVYFSDKPLNEVIVIFNSFIDKIFDSNSNDGTSNTDKFPFAVTPSKGTLLEGNNFLEFNNVNEIQESANFKKLRRGVKVKGNNSQTGCFVVSDNLNGKPTIGPLNEIKKEEKTTIDVYNSPITYSILGGQRIYLLSHNVTGPKGKIDLSNTIYGIRDVDFTKPRGGIRDLTYPTVRGDKLIELLRKMFEFMRAHVHPISIKIPSSISAGNGVSTDEIKRLLDDAENTILNQEIRIN